MTSHLASLFASIAIAVGLSAFPLLGQQPILLANTFPVVADTETTVQPVAASAPAPKPLTARWLDLKTLTHAQRYRSAFDQNDYRLFGDGQQRSIAEGTFKFDAEGRYTIGFRASSGRYFNWAFADYAGPGISARTGPGSGAAASHTPAEGYAIYQAILTDPVGVVTYSHLPSNGWEFYVRELYGSASPVTWGTVEFGSFGIERGLSSEITTFDDDGYLTGERVRLHDAKHLYFDQIGFTNAFLGNVGDPNLFSRGLELKSSNYRQINVIKKVSPRFAISGDYTWLIGTDTLHEAVTAETKELRFADRIRVEAYQRLNTITLQGLAVSGGSGFAVALDKKVLPRVDFGAGFASVDEDYTVYTGSRFAHSIGFGLNGDSYSMGKRPFLHANVRVNHVVSAFGFYTHHVGPRTVNLDQQNLNAGLSFDIKSLLNREKAVF